MKRNSFIALFIVAHVLFIFLQIYKHTQSIQHGYVQQELERQRDALYAKKQILLQRLHVHIDRESIKKFAGTKLKMRPITLSQIKKISEYDK